MKIGKWRLGPSGRHLLLAGLLEAALLGLLGWLPGGRGTPLPALALWGGAFLAYGAAAWALARGGDADPAPRSDGAPDRGPPSGDDRGVPALLALVWAVGLVLRLGLLPLTPHFSDDLFRYLWDGWVQLNGVNPFRYSPEAGMLVPLRTEWHDLINHPGVPTIYPPGAQAVFATLATISVSPLLFKGAWVLADLGVAWCVWRLVTTRTGATRPPLVALLLYLWSPLVVVEVAWSGHLEPLGILPMLLAVLVLRTRGSGSLAGSLLGAAAAVKYAPAAALPAVWRRRGFRVVLTFLATVVVLAAPYYGAGEALWAGLGEYARRWSFFPGPFRLLDAPLGGGEAARWAAGALVAGVAGTAAWRKWGLERTLTWVLGTGLVLSPTLHPWYVVWMLPLAAVRRIRAWILLSGLVVLFYGGLDAFRVTGEWPQPAWLAALAWVPFLALLAHDGWRAWRRAAPGAGAA